VGDHVTFNVVSGGQPLAGFTAEQAGENLSRLMKLPLEKAQQIVTSTRILKKGLSQREAAIYKQRLEAIGLTIQIERQDPQQFVPTMTLELEPVDEPATDSDSMEAEPTEAETAAPSSTITCPKCEHEQPHAEQCGRCGIYFHKLQSVESPQVPVDVDDSSDSEDEDSFGDNYEDLKVLTAQAIAAAAAAAFVGALVWKFIAVAFEYEFGIVAWGIGGAVGFAAAAAGSRGPVAGAICGALVVLSIMGGKFMAIETFQQQATEMLMELQGGEDGLRPFFEETLYDAETYVAVVTDDASLREFMVDHGYSEAMNYEDVSSEELDLFREYTAPELTAMAASPPTYEQWAASAFDDLEDVSTFDVMVESFGFLDVLFLFFGIGTAFRLGSRHGMA
jgi:hypothetical protein